MHFKFYTLNEKVTEVSDGVTTSNYNGSVIFDVIFKDQKMILTVDWTVQIVLLFSLLYRLEQGGGGFKSQKAN